MNASYDYTGLKFSEPSITLLRTKSADWGYEREWRQLFAVRKCQRLVDGIVCDDVEDEVRHAVVDEMVRLVLF